jgi:hypothetical protein
MARKILPQVPPTRKPKQRPAISGLETGDQPAPSKAPEEVRSPVACIDEVNNALDDMYAISSVAEEAFAGDGSGSKLDREVMTHTFLMLAERVLQAKAAANQLFDHWRKTQTFSD